MTTVSALATVTGAELRLRLRNPAFPLLAAVVVSACALLVPAPTASYTTVTVEGRRLLMSADTSLIAAAIVLGIVLLPVFALSFDVGHARDAEQGLDRLHLTTPVPPWSIAAGRLLANLVAVLGVILLSLLVLSSTLSARALGLPSLSAAEVFLLLVVPVGVAAVALGALLDRWLGTRAARRSIAAFVVWFIAMLASAMGGRDLFGVSYLRQVIVPGGHPKSLSVGAVSTQGLTSAPWTVAPLTRDLIGSRMSLIAALAAGVAVLTLVIRYRISTVEASGAGRDTGWLATDEPRSAAARVLPIRRETRGRASIGASVALVVRRWLARSRMAVALLVLTLLLATRSGAASSAAIAAALVIPAVVVSRMSRREVRVAATLEATTSALVRPTPAVTFGWMLVLLALVPELPALLRTGAVQAATAVLGLIAATLWLTWTHRCAERPVLGTATFAALWYLSVFNHPPARFDVFGLWGSSGQALVWSAAAAAVALALVVRHDRG